MNYDEHRDAIMRRPFEVQSTIGKHGRKFLTIPGCHYSDQAAALECLERNRATWSAFTPGSRFRIIDARKFLSGTFALSKS